MKPEDNGTTIESQLSLILQTIEGIKVELGNEIKNVRVELGALGKRIENIEAISTEIPSTFNEPSEYAIQYPDYHISLEERFDELSPTAKKILRELIDWFEDKKVGAGALELAGSEEKRSRYSSVLYYLYMAGFLVREEKNRKAKYYPNEEALSIVKSH